jgi:hypothetical protein
VGGIPNFPRFQINEDLGIPLRKVTDKMLGWSDTGENVLSTATNYAYLAYTCIKFFKKIKK